MSVEQTLGELLAKSDIIHDAIKEIRKDTKAIPINTQRIGVLETRADKAEGKTEKVEAATNENKVKWAKLAGALAAAGGLGATVAKLLG